MSLSIKIIGLVLPFYLFGLFSAFPRRYSSMNPIHIFHGFLIMILGALLVYIVFGFIPSYGWQETSAIQSIYRSLCELGMIICEDTMVGSNQDQEVFMFNKYIPITVWFSISIIIALVIRIKRKINIRKEYNKTFLSFNDIAGPVINYKEEFSGPLLKVDVKYIYDTSTQKWVRSDGKTIRVSVNSSFTKWESEAKFKEGVDLTEWEIKGPIINEVRVELKKDFNSRIIEPATNEVVSEDIYIGQCEFSHIESGQKLSVIIEINWLQYRVQKVLELVSNYEIGKDQIPNTSAPEELRGKAFDFIFGDNIHIDHEDPVEKYEKLLNNLKNSISEQGVVKIPSELDSSIYILGTGIKNRAIVKVLIGQNTKNKIKEILLNQL